MTLVGPGSLILCVVDYDGSGTLPPIYRGRVYTVVEAFDSYFEKGDFCSNCGRTHEDEEGPLALELYGQTTQEQKYAYCSCRFVSAGRGGMFQSLLKANTTKKERERVEREMTPLFTMADWAEKVG